jgi:predicted nucleic acid-binding protein
MLVIADSSPLIALVNIGHVDVLPKLFGQIVIPPAVAMELASPSRPQAVRDLTIAPLPWLKIQQPASHLQIPKLHPGESDALSLALELHADVLLIDERRAYKEAWHEILMRSARSGFSSALLPKDCSILKLSSNA